MNIAVDVLGGDYAPEIPLKGALLAKEELNGDNVVLLGDEKIISNKLKEFGSSPSQFDIVHSPDLVGMGDSPTKVLSTKPNSSISVGFKLLKEGNVDAIASTGNTGAMMVASMYSVRTIPGVIRPCITSVVPKESGGVGLILDVGSNADCKPDVLYQFGVLGSLFLENVYGLKSPKVGLLNIGEEPEKGNLLTQSAYELMNNSRDFNFIGNIEGRDLFNDRADVIVCDGFTGNVVIKLAESFYSMIKKRGWGDDYIERFNYEVYGGTPILGINSSVIIGHGISNEKAIKNMILLARNVANSKLSDKIKAAFN